MREGRDESVAEFVKEGRFDSVNEPGK